MAVNGVRNSWLASATNRRNLSSLVLRAAKASSIFESIEFRDSVSRPTSVLGLASGKRADNSPRAIAFAVVSTEVKGFRLIRTTASESNPINKRTIKPIRKNKTRNLFKVFSISSREIAAIALPAPEGSNRAKTLKCSFLFSIVNGTP